VPSPAALPSPRPGTADRALDEAIRQIPSEWFRPRPVIYWLDLVASAGIGWSAFVLALGSRSPWSGVFALVGLFALYRSVLFIHEITHLNARDVPAFKTVWNVLVGVPLLMPSFTYEGVHTDHHRQRCYGTRADPEYMPYGRRGTGLLIGSGLASLLAPVALTLRFGLLTPVSLVIPAVRRFTLARCSALAINPDYVRRAPIGPGGHAQELGAFAVVWVSALLWWRGWLPGLAFGYWFAAVSIASGVNALRTFAAHRYSHESHELSNVEQLLDTVTIAPSGSLGGRIADVGRALVAPVGLRFHALHHWIPSLPYHNLGRAHRLLLSTQSLDAPYRATVASGFAPVLRDLLHRSRTQAS
jgi:fatty acid desaturase